MFSLLLSLMLCLSLFAPSAAAANPPSLGDDGTAVWVYDQDGNGLFRGLFTVTGLREKGIELGDAGKAIRSIYLVSDTEGTVTDPTSDLTQYAKADKSGTKLTLPKEIFAENFGKPVFNDRVAAEGESPAEDWNKTYTMTVTYEPIDPAKDVTVTYSLGTLKDAIAAPADGSAAIVDGGDSFKLTRAELTDEQKQLDPLPLGELQSHTVLDLAAWCKDAAQAQNKRFLGWTLRYANGASVDVAAGEAILPYADVTLEARWGSLVTINISSAEKVYDGQPLTASVSVEGLADKDALSYEGSLSFTDAGSYDATIAKNSIKVERTKAVDGQEVKEDVTGEYDFVITPGKLSIKTQPITVTLKDVSAEYSASVITPNGETVTAGTLAEGHKLVASYAGQQQVPGSSEASATYKVLDAEGRDVTANYAITVVPGKLTVTQRSAKLPLTITVSNAEKVYDGKALTVKECKRTSGELLSGDTLKVDQVLGSQTNVGTSAGSVTVKVMHGEADVSDSYNITVVPATLTVKPVEITITANSANKKYDGSALKDDGYKISSGALVGGDKLSASVVGSQKDSGSSANAVDKNSIKVVDASGKDVSANYVFKTENGTLTVSGSSTAQSGTGSTNSGNSTKLSVTVNASKTYDGKAMEVSSSDLKVVGGSLPVGYKMEATFAPLSLTEVGKASVTINSLTIRDQNGNDVTAKYSVKRETGSAEITARPLTIETSSANKVYDGEPLSEKSSPSIIGRLDSDQVTLRINGSQTKVGSSDNTVTDVKIVDKVSGKDVTKNYAITYKYGKLTVTSASGDGTAATWSSGGSGTLYVKLEHDYDGFSALLVDGKEVDKTAYTTASGSTDIWLKDSFLNTLASGEHSISARYDNGDVESSVFTITEESRSVSPKNNSKTILVAVMLLALVAAVAISVILLRDNKRKKVIAERKGRSDALKSKTPFEKK